MKRTPGNTVSMNIPVLCLITLLSTPEGNICVFSDKMLNYVYQQVAGLLSCAEQRVYNGFISLEKNKQLENIDQSGFKKQRQTYI